MERYTRGHLIEFMWSTKLEVSYLTLINSPFWTVHPVYCAGFYGHHLTIINDHHSPNTDGIDPDSTVDVVIPAWAGWGAEVLLVVSARRVCMCVLAAEPGVWSASLVLAPVCLCSPACRLRCHNPAAVPFPPSTRQVLSHNYISTGDDCYALKSGWDKFGY